MFVFVNWMFDHGTFSQEIADASQQTQEKRSRLEAARRAREETAAAVRANVDACTTVVMEAAAHHKAAVDRHSAMTAAIDQLSQHLTTRSSEATLAQVELEARSAAVSGLENEYAQAVEARRLAEGQMRVAKAAHESHVKDGGASFGVVVSGTSFGWWEAFFQ